MRRGQLRKDERTGIDAHLLYTATCSPLLFACNARPCLFCDSLRDANLQEFALHDLR